MAYTKVQFIGYVLDTAPQLNPNGSETYLGLNNPQQDIEARCSLMRRAMETARDALPTQSPPAPTGSTLKVFMAPEFFFRGAAGAYPMDDVQLAIAALQNIAADDQWSDWMFVFGTILGVSSPTLPQAPYDIDPLATQEVYNFALVQLGGVATQGDTGARVVMKELKSNIDFIATNANPGGLLWGQVEPLQASIVGGAGRERQQVNYDGAGIFELAGITWGLEVCLDHHPDVRRLQRSPQLPGENLVQLQLVPSCGMAISEPSVIVETGGYIFNCDGYRLTSHAELQQQVPPLTSVAPLMKDTPVSDAPIALQSTSPINDVAISALYAHGAGVIRIYSETPIPAQQTVQGKPPVELSWQASVNYRFVFTLIYDTTGNYVNTLVEIISSKVNFYGHKYYVPLLLQTQDSSKQDVFIQMNLVAGSGGYAGALWCKINVPGFIFEGNAFEFSATSSGPEPLTVW
ncbi:MAG: hypothetical protein FD135_2495 [Comamonadaceae bacterium]|nr:MAG: hypothetical protein FD135_2495 [Comamonadaceae bacterium]